MTALLVASLFALAAVATTVSADSPSGEKREVFGPGGVTVKGVLGLGVGVCTIPDLPFPCAVAGAGAAFYNVSSWNTETGATDFREATVWAGHVDGAAIVDPGFEMTACSDRDDTSICTNADDTDDFVTARSNAAQYAYKDDPCEKDSKDCDDPTNASLGICIQRDVDGFYDDVVVFVSSWVDVGLGGNIGDGTSFGTFNVYLDAGAFRDGYPGDGSGNDCGADFPHQGVPNPECSDGVDNDGKGDVDGADPDCTGPDDNSEEPFLKNLCRLLAQEVRRKIGNPPADELDQFCQDNF